MKKDLDHNSTDSAEIEALITRLERGQLRHGDAQLLARLSRLLQRRPGEEGRSAGDEIGSHMDRRTIAGRSGGRE